MVVPEITPRAFFALSPDVQHNAHYITDFQILYPAGCVLILHNYYEKRQKFIKLLEKSLNLEMIIVSPSRKLAAIILNGERGQIFIFDMQSLKKRRTLNLPNDAVTNRFETLCFTHDDNYIMAVTGEPDWNLVTYKWEKGKVVSTMKAAYTNSPNAVAQVCCSPTDTKEVCLVGPGLFRLLILTETVWRQYGFQKADQINVTSATYISGDTILCGTADGKLFFIENGDLKGVFNAITATSLNVKEKDDASTIASSSLLVIKAMSNEAQREDLSVRALISFPKGFAYSCKAGYVHMFEKEANNKFKKRNVFRIISDIETLQQEDLIVVKHLSINVSQDKLLATTNRAQIYTVRLWGPDLNVAPEIPFKNLGESLHHGPITGLTICIWKPIFATSGEIDHTIRLWNYETETVQIIKQYSEKIYSVELHPMGSFMAIGFKEKLHYAIVLMNDIQTIRTFPIQECYRSRFCFNGNYVAIVNQNNIEILGTILFQSVHHLQGHIGKINALSWTLDDKKLASCGSEGAIYIWDVSSGKILRDFQTPGVCYYDISMSIDGKFLYAVGSDGLLKEITESSMVRSIKMNQSSIDNIVLSRSNLMMFLTGDSSGVLSVKMPLTDPPEYSVFHYHAAKINQIKITFDDQTLLSISERGSVIIWKLNFAEGKTVHMDKNFVYSTEVLINKDELEKKILTIKDLSQKLYELEMGQAREMRDKETAFIDSIKELHESFGVVITELKEKVEQTELDQQNQLAAIKRDITNLKVHQQKEKAEMIQNYTSKLAVEYEKVKRLDALKEETVSDFESRVAELQQSKEDETNEIIQVYAEKLKDVENLLKEAAEEHSQNIKEHETIRMHTEEDADREIVETKSRYEGILREEKELNVVLKEEAIIMRKNYTEALKERDEYQAKAEILQEGLLKYQGSIHSLEKDIVDLKTEIVDRDQAIVEKDKRIHSLKQKIQELEKFKFVLDYKIRELKNQIDPKDREIRERKEQISDMEEELSNLKKINSSLELQLVELKEKIYATEREVNNYEKKHQSGVNTLRQIKVDIYSLYHDLNDHKKLKDGIKYLYHKYYQEEIPSWEQYGDTDLQREFMIQREFLEKTIMALKSTLRKNQQNKPSGTKVVQDNVVLLEELNTIRKELKMAVRAVKNLEKLIGENGQISVVPSEAFNRLEAAFKNQQGIRGMYQEVIDEADQEAINISNKVKKLQEKFYALAIVERNQMQVNSSTAQMK